jgi:FkbM family methyltransferase
MQYSVVNPSAARGMKALLSKSVHRAMELTGYWMRRRSVLPHGIDYQFDIKRVSETLDIPIRVFFDIGAHTGETSASAFGSFDKVCVFAFEPHKPTFDRLISAIPSTKNFRAFNIAMSNKAGQAPFFQYGETATSNSMVENSQYAMYAKHPSRKLSIECQTVDNFSRVHDIFAIDVLKIDTERHDLEVLQGAEQMLRQHKVRFVYAEFNSIQPRAEASGGALSSISDLIEPIGFRFVATYPDYMDFSKGMHVGANALFVLPNV